MYYALPFKTQLDRIPLRPINYLIIAALFIGGLCWLNRSWGGVESNVTPKELPMQFTLIPMQDTYSAKKPILLKAALKAMQPLEVCFHPGHLEADFKFDVSRGGFGKVDIPQSVQLPKDATVNKISLYAGQTQNIALDLKKLMPLQSTAWVSGDYRIYAKFFLCGKTEGSEQPIPVIQPIHIYIQE